MPVYEYRCRKCGHQFERMQRVNDPNPPCPAVLDEDRTAPVTCGAVTEKVLSTTNFALKGSGWASDGYS